MYAGHKKGLLDKASDTPAPTLGFLEPVWKLAEGELGCTGPP